MSVIIIDLNNAEDLDEVTSFLDDNCIDYTSPNSIIEEEKIQHIMAVLKDYSLQEIESLLQKK